MFKCRITCLLLIGMSILGFQPHLSTDNIDPKQNLISILKPIQQADSYQVKGRIVITINAQDEKSKPRTIEQQFNIISRGENFARLFLNTPQGNIQIYRNGEVLTIYSENDKKYMERDTPKGLYALGLIGIPTTVDELLHNKNTDSLEFEVVSYKTISDTGSGKPEEQFELKTEEEGNITLWFTKENSLPVRVEADLTEDEVSSGGKKVFYFEEWNLKPALEESTFQFTPPEGVTKIERQEQKDPMLGKKAPEFTLPTLDGKKVSLSEFKGKKVVVLDFWASWCGPCRMAMPVVQQVSEELKDRDVVFFAVNLGEDKEKINNFISRIGIKLPVLMDATGKVGTQYQVQSIPRLVIIDKNGIVQGGHSGFSNSMKKQLKEEIIKLLETK